LKYNHRLVREGEFLLKHYNVLSLIVVLLVGAWSIVAFRQKSRRFPESRLVDLLRYLIFYNIIELEVFLIIYFDSNLTPQQSVSFFSWYKGVDWPLRTLLIVGLYVFQYKTIAWLRGKTLAKWVTPAVGLFAALLMGLFFLDMRFANFLPESPYLKFWNLLIWPLNLLALIWLVRLWLENRQGTDPDRRRAGRAFAWLFAVRIPFHLAVILLGPGMFVFWNISATRLLALYTNIIPVFWLWAYYIPWAGSLGKIISGRVDIPSLQKSHGLSAREMEILNLLIDGKSYRQMEESLHISIHTVKSHAYSLYRKMQVKSRHQLIHMISTSQQENP
jgi:DNA-binding CsgD family transcriptional regulator